MTRVRHLLLAAFACTAACMPADAPPSGTGHPIAVLGNSDSHSYHDDVWLGTDPSLRGGAYRATTWQWTEVLHQLRPEAFDFGPFDVHGVSPRVGRILRWVGIARPVPRKRDFRHVFAWSGAGCRDIESGWAPQLPPLLSLLRRQPTRWNGGVIVVRIGVNSFGQSAHLDALAAGDTGGAVHAAMRDCVAVIDRVIAAVHDIQPQVRLVLVGAQDNTNWPRELSRWRDPAVLARLRAIPDAFDTALRARVARDSRLAYFDDRDWFRRQWGDRDATAAPAYTAVQLGGRAAVTNTEGDEPIHAVVRDGHAGTVYNALWAGDLVSLLNGRFGMGIPEITREEIRRLADPGGRFGL